VSRTRIETNLHLLGLLMLVRASEGALCC